MNNIWNWFKTPFMTFEIMDILDIAIIAFAIFYVLKFIRERRAGKLGFGILVFFVLLFISEILDMVAMNFLMSNVVQVGIIALIIIFQPELRSVLEKMGTGSLNSIKGFAEQKEHGDAGYINAICDAAASLSREYTGALIVIERDVKLADQIESGTVINAQASASLIKNIFFNKAPLHDGALIVRNGRLYAAGCFLPISTNDDITKNLGTRHRAAIGMSENSDAVVVIVSEETGTISIAQDGKLLRNFDHNSLKTELFNLLTDEKKSHKKH